LQDVRYGDTQAEVEDLERHVEELRDEAMGCFDDLLRLVGELPGSRRKREASVGGGRVVRIGSPRWRRR